MLGIVAFAAGYVVGSHSLPKGWTARTSFVGYGHYELTVTHRDGRQFQAWGRDRSDAFSTAREAIKSGRQ